MRQLDLLQPLKLTKRGPAPSCECGKCKKCKNRAYQQKYYVRQRAAVYEGSKKSESETK